MSWMQAIFENILNRNLTWPDDPDSDVSEECKDLIDRLLEPNPEERLGHRGAGEVQDLSLFAFRGSPISGTRNIHSSASLFMVAA